MMFTGIVTEMGTVVAAEPTASGRRLTIDAPGTVPGMVPGDSVAVNGACLTATELTGATVSVDVVQESLDRTNLGEVGPGDRVNLERPLAVNGRFDGHVVQGHVDGVATVAVMTSEGDARRVRVSVPGDLAAYLVEKGSVTLDGVSLTVTAVSPPVEDPAWCEVVLIPHTLAVTVLGSRAAGSRINVEADVLAKYVARHLASNTAGRGA